jgi:hypothetical protein
MGIKRFIGLLSILAILFLFYDIKNVQKNVKNDEKPLVSFYDSVSYRIDEESVKSIVRSSEAYMFQKREEMVGATMYSRDGKQGVANFLKSDYVTKIGDDFYFEGNVFFQSKDGLELTTEQLEYNIVSKIVKNYLEFDIEHKGNNYKGKKLFYDSINNNMNAEDIKFLLKVNNG